jgi:hypothetical protein
VLFATGPNKQGAGGSGFNGDAIIPLELEDSFGPYNKSIAYLISRALETTHKTPLAGMHLSWVTGEDRVSILKSGFDDRSSMMEWGSEYISQQSGYIDFFHENKFHIQCIKNPRTNRRNKRKRLLEETTIPIKMVNFKDYTTHQSLTANPGFVKHLLSNIISKGSKA